MRTIGVPGFRKRLGASSGSVLTLPAPEDGRVSMRQPPTESLPPSLPSNLVVEDYV
jgi:hypothetical protein